MNEMCTYCGIILPLKEFSKETTRHGDLLCKECIDVACSYCGEEEGEHETINNKFACSTCHEEMFDVAYEEM